MTSQIGAPAIGEDFFDREVLLKDIWNAVEKGSVLLSAPRRVGKTSLMHRMRPDSHNRGYNAIFIEAEEYSSPEELVTDLLSKLDETLPKFRQFLKKLLSGAISNIDEMEGWQIRLKLRENLQGSWKEKGKQSLQHILNGENRILLLIDELPILLHKMASTDEGSRSAVELLHWLRALRQEFAGKLSMVLGSSIGIGQIVSYLDASRTLNDLQQIEVGPFDEETAREFTKKLLSHEDMEVDDDTLQAILDTVETYLPMFIQIMVASIVRESREKNESVNPTLVHRCYEERVHGPEFKLHFEDYYERLGRYYTPPETRAAKKLLRELAISEISIDRTTLYSIYKQELGVEGTPEGFDLLFAALENDFYLKRDASSKKICFHNKWLRDWWRRYHVLGS